MRETRPTWVHTTFSATETELNVSAALSEPSHSFQASVPHDYTGFNSRNQHEPLKSNLASNLTIGGFIYIC